MRILLALPFFLILLLAGCKKDNPAPVATSFTLKDVHLDGLPRQTSYTNVSISPAIVLKFSDRIDHTTASKGIILEGPDLAALDFNYSNNDSTVTLTPLTPLAGYSFYRLYVTPSLASASGLKFNTNITINVITRLDMTDKFPRISDDALLDSVQKGTLRYFYEYAHPASGMALERNSSGNIVTTGGSGFGLMALVAGIERGFIPRSDGIQRFVKIISFLEKADRFHGAWPHWIDGSNGKVIPFSTNDNGAELVETSYMAQGLITLRQYLQPADTAGNNLINRINTLWTGIEWDWFRQEDQKNVLYWHWSPDKAWIMNFPLFGYFEEQITYFMAAASPTHGIPKIVYAHGFGQDGAISTNRPYTYNGETYTLPLGSPAPLFWVQYSYLGLNPHFSDDYADYWTQNVNATLINHAYCVQDPKHYVLYSDSCWGLTASDNPSGYDAQSPGNDNGTITPTAALSSFPYTPDQSMKALKFFYYKMGDKLWGRYGFYDAFNPTQAWVANSALAIDQGPIIIMIENYRSNLLWNLFESAPEVKAGRLVLDFH